jgi:serine/threonine protein kinase
MPVQNGLQDTLGPYRLFEKIGEGGMGVVYLARDYEGRPVAVKALGPSVSSDPNARRRLQREVETMRRVRSPYVAEILDADVGAAQPYIVTRYVPGRTLDEVVQAQGPLRGAALARLAAGLADALAAIHAAGVVHRDLKPGNVMLVDDHPVVIDFGIAHVADAATRLTMTGMVMGTPGYLAPEVIEGQPSSGASDVHSWGATVAYAATGRSPYGGGSYQTIFYRVVTGQSDLTGVPGPMMTLVSAALSLNPAGRPPADWLAGQCAALNPAGLLSPGGAIPPKPPLRTGDYPPPVPPGGAYSAPASPGPRQGAYSPAAPPSPKEAATSVADLLPPAVDEPRARSVNGDSSRGTSLIVREDEAAERAARRPTSYWPLTLAFMVIAISLSVLMPVAGAVASLAVITLLRAADRAGTALAVRRSSRGVRPTDVLVGVLTAPWALARAVVTTVLMAPLAIAAGAVAAIVAVIMLRMGTNQQAQAGGWAAGAIVAWYGVGPGSRRPRRQLGRVFGSVVRTRAALAVAAIAFCSLAAAAVTQATSQTPLYWPYANWMLPHLPSLSSALGHADHWLLTNTAHLIPGLGRSRG